MPLSVDVDLINAFWRATVEAFQVMGGMEARRLGLGVKRDDSASGDYYAVIGLSQGLVGSVAVGFPRQSAQHIVGSLFGETLEQEALLVDGVGEICNLIAGGGKKHLAGSGWSFAISPPTTMVNRDPEPMRVFNPAGTLCVVISCGVQLGAMQAPFAIDLALQAENASEIRRRKG